MTIEEPGIYDLTNADYHADPALSASGAKMLIPPSAPALFRYAQDHPVYRDIFDFGSAAHKVVLDDRTSFLSVIDAPDWKTKAARDARDEARALGLIPVLPQELSRVQAMAEAIRAHPIASKLFDPDTGTPERSLFWRDEESGLMLRARLDWLPRPGVRPRFIVPDYKTAHSAERSAFSKSVASFGYHLQAAWYLDAVQALGIARDPAFVFVVQEKEAPYLVNVIELDRDALEIGRDLNRLAIRRFIECQKTGIWPGYSDDVQTASLPVWYVRNYEESVAE